MANPPNGRRVTKNPGPRGGGTGARIDLAGERDQAGTYPERQAGFKADLTAWASACDEWFEALERQARVDAALDVLRLEGVAA